MASPLSGGSETAQTAWQNSPLSEIASVVVRFDHIARFIENAYHSPLRLGSLRCKGDCCGRAGANVARRKALRRDLVTFSSDCDDRGREPRTIPKRLCPVQPDADEIRHRALRRRRRHNCRSWSWCRTWSWGRGCSRCRVWSWRCSRPRRWCWRWRTCRSRHRCPSRHGKGIDFVAGGEVNATASNDASITCACCSSTRSRPRLRKQLRRCRHCIRVSAGRLLRSRLPIQSLYWFRRSL